ncbi:MAG: hypothetical protein VX363_03335 [Pseudomonadota bacterium]
MRTLDIPNIVRFNELVTYFRNARLENGEGFIHTLELISSVEESVARSPGIAACIISEMESKLFKDPTIAFEWHFDFIHHISGGSWNIGGNYFGLWYPRIVNRDVFVSMISGDLAIDRKISMLEAHTVGRIRSRHPQHRTYLYGDGGLQKIGRMANLAFRCMKFKAFEKNIDNLSIEELNYLRELIELGRDIVLNVVSGIGEFHQKNNLNFSVTESGLSVQEVDNPAYRFPWD